MAAIGIDYTPGFEQKAGIGRYVRELIHALGQHDSDNDYRLFVAGARRDQLPPTPSPRFSWHSTRLTPRWLARLWYRAHIPLPVQMFTGNLALFHATDFVLPPVSRPTRTLLTVHDLSFVRVPEAASPRLKQFLDHVVPSSARRADHILADSQATKDDLVAVYALPPEKITVLLSGVDSRFHHTRLGILTIRSRYAIGERPYIFTIGTVQPRKNYVRLVKAVARLRQAGYDLDLVISGGKGWLADPLYDAIRDEHMNAHVHFIGFAHDADLPALYSGAEMVAFPSLYEGFGFPVLEGMACGTPVITSHVSSLPEVAGDAALLVDPLDIDALTDAMQRVLDDTQLRTDMVQKGYAQAKRFTWDASARHLQQIYTQLTG